MKKVLLTLLFIILLLFLRSKCVMNYVVGNSMANTLLPNERIINNPFFKELKRGDIVVYKIHKNKLRIARVIGMPNENIEIIGHDVFINGTIINENYRNDEEPPIKCYQGMYCGPLVVEEGKYFLLGDNRGMSNDSRFRGLIKREDIKAKVLYSFSLFERFQKIETPNYNL